MNINKTHHIDCGDKNKDGLYGYYYEYDIFTFSFDDITIIVRKYSDEESAHFLRQEKDGKKESVKKEDLFKPSFSNVIDYLKKSGVTKIQYLSNNGYTNIPNSRMARNIQLTGSPHLKYLNVCTPGDYAMDVAVDVLNHLDSYDTITVKNTGWKNGFGIEVCAWIPIKSDDCDAELMTDGDTFEVRQTAGSLKGFELLYDLIKSHLSID